MGDDRRATWRRFAVVSAAMVLLVTLSLDAAAFASGDDARTGAPAAAKLQTFRLPSALVDPSTPGGNLPDGQAVPKLHVLLPRGYADHPDRDYPVLWLLHGAGGGTDTWIPGVKQLFAGFAGIIVMPDGGRFGMYTDWWNGGTRRDPAWATYHLKELRRLVERRYRIRPERRWHAIAGISMGGQGALRYSALLPGYFGSVATLSAAFPDMQSPVAEGGLTALASFNGADGATYESIFGPVDGAYAEGNSPLALAPNYGHTRMYLTSGDGTNCPQDPVTPNVGLDSATEAALHAQQTPFAEAARASGADVTAVPTCGVHTFGVWDRAFAAIREWGIFAAVPELPKRWVYRTTATSGEMWGLRFRFARPPVAVAEFTRAGRTLTASGEGEVVISGPRGCRLMLELPAETRLPSACRRLRTRG
jgi:S-formylglutathione hydrolase FrmB